MNEKGPLAEKLTGIFLEETFYPFTKECRKDNPPTEKEWTEAKSVLH